MMEILFKSLSNYKVTTCDPCVWITDSPDTSDDRMFHRKVSKAPVCGHHRKQASGWTLPLLLYENIQEQLLP